MSLPAVVVAIALSQPSEVKVYGALRSIIREDKRVAQVKLADLRLGPTTIGLGAAENLDGEVTIIDGKLILDRVRGGRVERMADPRKAGAALLAVCDVSGWHKSVLKGDVAPQDLDQFIERQAKAFGLDTTKRIPVKVFGRFTALDAHIIDGTKIPKGPSTHEAHMNSGVKLTNATEPGTIVGFFSKSDAGTLTHHTSSTHLHVSCSNRVFAGHVDAVGLAAGCTVMLGDPK